MCFLLWEITDGDEQLLVLPPGSHCRQTVCGMPVTGQTVKPRYNLLQVSRGGRRQRYFLARVARREHDGSLRRTRYRLTMQVHALRDALYVGCVHKIPQLALLKLPIRQGSAASNSRAEYKSILWRVWAHHSAAWCPTIQGGKQLPWSSLQEEHSCVECLVSCRHT